MRSTLQAVESVEGLSLPNGGIGSQRLLANDSGRLEEGSVTELVSSRRRSVEAAHEKRQDHARMRLFVFCMKLCTFAGLQAVGRTIDQKGIKQES